MAITFDASAVPRVIQLDDSVTRADVLWSRFVDWQAENQWAPLALTSEGGSETDPSQGKFSPRFFFVEDGWVVKPPTGVGTLRIVGFLIKRGGGSPIVANPGETTIVVQDIPASAEAIATAGSTAPTAQQNAIATRIELEANSPKLAQAAQALPATSYTAPPTAVQIRQEIDANSTKLDAAVSTRATPAQVSAAIATDRAAVVEAGLTQDGMLRVIAALVAGNYTTDDQGNVSVRGLDGTTVRVSGEADGDERTATFNGAPTP